MKIGAVIKKYGKKCCYNSTRGTLEDETI